MKKKHNHSGQVALIMVLIMTVVSAVAVSLASRTTVETRIQQMNLENTEALMTAQAGLEDSIAKNAPVTGMLGTGNLYQVTLGDSGVNGVISDKINPGEAFEVNLEGASSVTQVKLYWNGAVAGETPTIFVSDIRDTQDVDYAYDGAGVNGFTRVNTGGTFEGVNYSYSTPSPITISTTASKKLRMTVLGSAAFLAVEPIGGQFPPQSTDYRSVADVSTTGQGVTRYGIQYKESKTDLLPSVFDYVLFSGGTIVQ